MRPASCNRGCVHSIGLVHRRSGQLVRGRRRCQRRHRAERDGVHIKHFTQKFGKNGFLGGICQADYGPIFAQAVGVIATACDNFIPPN